MKQSPISVERDFRIEFYDVDSMNVAWHGHYVKYMEIGRCALLDEIGYGYEVMAESGYLWPVVDMRLKYIRPLRFKQDARIKASLIEFENRLKIRFEIFDRESGEKTTTAESTQMAVEASTGESCFVSPKILIDKVEHILREKKR